MSTQLEDNIVEILRQRDNYLIPENIREGVTILGVNGTLTSGIDTSDATATAGDILLDKTAYVDGEKITGTYIPSGGDDGVKLFTTVEEMNNDTDKHIGDKAVVYKGGLFPVAEDSTFSGATFPSTVTLDSAVSGTISGSFTPIAGQTGYFDGYVQLTSTSFNFNGWGDEVRIYVTYTSSDGINYTRTDNGTDYYDFNTIVRWGYYGVWDDRIGNFLLAQISDFKGFYEADSNLNYNIIETQLDATPSDVYKKTFYSSNGVQTGTLGTPDNTFKDANAQIFNDVLYTYLNMSPVIVTDANKSSVDFKNISVVPKNINDETLLNTSAVTSFFQLFQGNSKITYIAKLDTRNVTDFGSAFYYCQKLKIMEGFTDTSNVTNFQSAFYGCREMKEMPLGITTTNATQFTYMFYDCSSLKSVYFLDVSNAQYMNGMFAGCTALEDVPVLYPTVVDSACCGGLFENCPNLTDESLNNILMTCINATGYNRDKTLQHLARVTSAQAQRCTSLSNYQSFLDAGWTLGY